MTVNPRIVGAVAACVVCSGIGYGVARYTVPTKVETGTKVETKTEIQYVDRVVEHRVEGPVRTVIRTVERTGPCEAGTAPTSESIITIDEGPDVTDTVTDSTGQASTATKVETRTVTVFTQPRYLVQGGLDLGRTWSVAGNVRALGPGWVGLQYRHDLSSKPLERLTLQASFSF